MRTTLTVLAAAAILTATGCTTTPAPTGKQPTAAVISSGTRTVTEAPPTAGPAPMDGSTTRDLDGITVTVTAPKRLNIPVTNPEPTAVAVGFIVQVVNGSGMDVEAGNINVLTYVGADGHEAPLTFAVEQGYPGGFTGVIPDGATRTAGYAWIVAAADLPVIETQVETVTSPTAPAIFRGAAE